MENSPIDQKYIDEARARVNNAEEQRQFDEAVAGMQRLADSFPTAAEGLKSGVGALFQGKSRTIRQALIRSGVDRAEAETIAEKISSMYQELSGYTAYMGPRGAGAARGY